ncbi:hypothetical protein DV515_00010717, partial [Chloebia gouldiae]
NMNRPARDCQEPGADSPFGIKYRSTTLQKEKIAQSKFKGTDRVTEERVKSEEMQILKQQIAGLQEELKGTEPYWHAACSKLRDQAELLTRQNMELRDELRGECEPYMTQTVIFEDNKRSLFMGIDKLYISPLLLEEDGTKKELGADERMTLISFSKADVKKIMTDQRVIYYYAGAQTTNTAYPDGLEVLQFPNNQIEKHYPDGTQEIVLPDHTVEWLYGDGLKETFFSDGIVVKVEKSRDKLVVLSDGQREIHTVQFRRREYPDGIVKAVFCNGRQETKCSTGKLQIKDEEGILILDK